jgi:hypothetical protein
MAGGPAEFTCFALTFRRRGKFGRCPCYFIGGALAHRPDMIEIEPIEKDEPF